MAPAHWERAQAAALLAAARSPAALHQVQRGVPWRSRLTGLLQVRRQPAVIRCVLMPRPQHPLRGQRLKRVLLPVAALPLAGLQQVLLHQMQQQQAVVQPGALVQGLLEAHRGAAEQVQAPQQGALAKEASALAAPQLQTAEPGMGDVWRPWCFRVAACCSEVVACTDSG